MLDVALDRLQLELVDLTAEEALRRLGEAFEEVALETCSWVADVQFSPTAPPGVPNHVPSPVHYARPGYVLSVSSPRGMLPRLAVLPAAGETGAVLAWWSPYHGAVAFSRPVPEGSSFTATVALVPKPDALNHLPDGVWSMWKEAAITAALIRLVETPSRPFSAPARGVVERAKLRRELGRLRIMGRQGHSHGGPVLMFPTRVGKR